MQTHSECHQEIVRDSPVRGDGEVFLRIEGTVQGVGFRPFVCRLARAMGVRGWVLNDARGVLIGAAARRETLVRFEGALLAEPPPAARIDRLCHIRPGKGFAAPSAAEGFAILPSRNREGVEAALPPDLAVCPDCLREMRDPHDRRYRYPFINCTNCGPRYSIIEAIPYDRPGTTMRDFEMCPDCRAEYEDPGNRRFHAQPVACPSCGPVLTYLDKNGTRLAGRKAALPRAIARLRAGGIVAVKGIGGFHLMCDAANDRAVATLRRRKHREEKPFAVMAPYLSAARRLCVLSSAEEALLASERAPIVLAPRREVSCGGVSRHVAPGNPLLGVLLPYSPVHYMVMESWQGFLVATSGNLSDEPICIDESEAIERLRGIADGFLVHNRPIARPVDDSVVRFMRGEPVVLRRARGYAPSPVAAPDALPPLLAAGGHLKNTVAVTAGGRLFPSQHIGDLSTSAAFRAFTNAVELLSQLYAVRPQAVVCDLHPDYPSTTWANRQGLPVIRVQHHHAHVLSCLAEHALSGPVLGVSWDGTGYGPDRTVWGGEWLVADRDSATYTRLASLRSFPLPGGEAAIRRPALSALGMLRTACGEDAFGRSEIRSLLGFSEREVRNFDRMIARGLNTPTTTSAGRLFDGVAALLGLGRTVSFEAQAAVQLEFLAAGSDDGNVYGFDLLRAAPRRGGEAASSLVVDWTPVVRRILDELAGGTERSVIARRFHNTLARMILSVARERPELPVILTGGCFQNKCLFESAATHLEAAGFRVYGHREVPPNDGGLSVGQILAAAAKTKEAGIPSF